VRARDEWSGNTGMGGDRDVFYRREGRPIHRSSRILVAGQEPQQEDCFTAKDLFRALSGEDVVIIAHVRPQITSPANRRQSTHRG
jgi:hypothetical protein